MPYDLIDRKAVPRQAKPGDVLKKIIEESRYVDMQFVDVRGRMQHFTVSSHTFDEDSFKTGFPKVDGSSIKGFSGIQDSDLVFVPDPVTYAKIPWRPGISRMIGKIYRKSASERLPSDTRGIAESLQDHLASMGMTAVFGPELEFFVFDEARWDVDGGNHQMYMVASNEAPYGDNPYRLREKEGYYPVPPMDSLMDYRVQVSDALFGFGILPEVHHHEVAASGQIEINFYMDTLVGASDSIVTVKSVAREMAKSVGKYATFMPKPIFGDNGSGMHVHVSIWDGNGYDLKKNRFYDSADDYAEISQEGRYFAGGLLEHSRSLASLVAPTTNSYRRLVPGYEAPTFVAWSRGNRSANVRIPVYRSGKEKEKRIEFRTPDPSCNPYVALPAIVLAGLDGIRRKIDPGSPVDRDLYELSDEELKELGVKRLPESLKEAVEELKSDNEYLKPFFSMEVLNTIEEIELHEFNMVNARPNPYEFMLYFDA
ncbi:MAG: type I glutamate--ammonia ligase [Nitrososphaeria archaeon]